MRVLQREAAPTGRRGLPAVLHTAHDVVTRHAASLRLAGLFGILAFAFWMGMRPHWNYPYPIHVDEWFGIGYAQATLHAGSLDYPSPYEKRLISYHPEMGFHLIWGFLKSVTGLSWMALYRVAPGVLLALLAFFAYALGHRRGFGWAAALFVPLMPTSLWTLGPAFVVPVSTAILLIPVMLLALHRTQEGARSESLWVLLILVVGTLFIHPTTEAVATPLAALYVGSFFVEALAKRRYRGGALILLNLGVRLLVPVIVLGFWLPEVTKGALIHATWTRQQSPFPAGLQPDFVGAFGTEGVLLALVGLSCFIYRGEFGLRSFILPLATLALFAWLTLFPQYSLGPDSLYDRGWSHLALFLAIFTGYAVSTYFHLIPGIARAVSARVRRPVSGWVSATLGCGGVALIIFILMTGLLANPERQKYVFYYHLVGDSNVADYAWIGQHLAPGRWVALRDPSMGWAYPPLAGPGTRMYEPEANPYTTPGGEKMRSMMASGQVDMEWLRQTGIAVVYTCEPAGPRCSELDTPGLFKVRRGVYYVPGVTAGD